MYRINLINKRYHRLIVIAFVYKQRTNSYWKCLCDCGNFKVVKGSHLRDGGVQSCGCLVKEIASKLSFKHGFSNSKNRKEYLFYHVLCSMKNRCLNQNHDAYYNYGGRGIMIDPRWLDKEHGFENFKIDMWDTYEVGLTLDRLNNDLLINGYSKFNCKWVTYKENQNNRRTSVKSDDKKEHDRWNANITATLHRVLRKKLEHSEVFEKYIGCTLAEFTKYIESLWEPWMTWDNFGMINKNKKTWQFDHIRQKNTFDLSKEEDRLKCFNYKNVRPLLALTNYKEKIRSLELA